MGTKLRCKKCGDIIESKHSHDFKWCKCHSCYIDGGNDYCRVGGNKEDYEFVEDKESKRMEELK